MEIEIDRFEFARAQIAEVTCAQNAALLAALHDMCMNIMLLAYAFHMPINAAQYLFERLLGHMLQDIFCRMEH